MSLQLADNFETITSTYLIFKSMGKSKSGLTEIIEVRSKSNQHLVLGRITWFAPWRKYCFHPQADTVWDADCLRDLQNFLVEVNLRDKQAKAGRKRLGPAEQGGETPKPARKQLEGSPELNRALATLLKDD